MARDIEKRLQQLRTRRAGADRAFSVNETARDQIFRDQLQEENWQKRARDKPYTRYALGAMQEVDARYTEISIETAGRVQRQLKSGLDAKGIPSDFRLQGSVPLNVHIRGVSDVDLLTIEDSIITYDPSGHRARSGLYTSPTESTSVGALYKLRIACENILDNAYPAATVDKKGGKAIALSGGSLARPVDVVPSHWHDTADYQRSILEKDRGITILDKNTLDTVANLPFLHIDRINSRDQLCNQGLKKAIRLVKHLKNDANAEGKSIGLPSFDIAAILYHADIVALRMSNIYELAVLGEAQRFFDALYHDESSARSLMTPDGSRPVINTAEKYSALKLLSVELDDLTKEVAVEQAPLYKMEGHSLQDSRRVLSETFIPST